MLLENAIVKLKPPSLNSRWVKEKSTYAKYASSFCQYLSIFFCFTPLNSWTSLNPCFLLAKEQWGETISGLECMNLDEIMFLIVQLHHLELLHCC